MVWKTRLELRKLKLIWY